MSQPVPPKPDPSLRNCHQGHQRAGLLLILTPGDYVRWLSDEPDPSDPMRPFPAEPMRMWPISTRVNKPENDDPSIVEPIELSAA